MKSVGSATPSSRAQWNGSRLLFEIVDRGERVSCSVSGAALEDISERRLFKPADFVLCFENARAHIEAVALGKSAARAAGTVGTVHVWADDLDPPPADLPAAAALAN